MAAKNSTPDETRLDTHLDAPSTTAPGDGPADTTDPDERAVSATPDKGAAALAGHGTVNAVLPAPKKTAAKRTGKDRTETYPATRPDGTEVTVERNIETGESTVKDG
ncbi:hypothetical protein [Streptomyces sp. Z26]|uniref:hypothetical protein n=1 Tax=Streptomyces sp. Z26 TaxID=2500177 RepID=UPI00140496CE|nr:hypothetical protein [Streptomyces sp. Z26]